MKYREQRDRFLFIGERILNVIVTLSYIGCVFGIVYIVGTAALNALSGGDTLSTVDIIICIVLLVAFLFLKWLSKYLEKKHYELSKRIHLHGLPTLMHMKI